MIRDRNIFGHEQPAYGVVFLYRKVPVSKQCIKVTSSRVNKPNGTGDLL